MHFLKRLQRPTTQPRSHNAPAPGSSPTSDDYLLYIHTVCPTKNAPAGEIIVENQTALDNLYVIINGALEVTITTKYAPYTLELSKGNFFGFIPDQVNDQCHYTIRSISSTVFIELSKRIFDNFPDGMKQKIYEFLNRKMSELFSKNIKKAQYLSEKNSRLVSYINDLNSRRKKTISSELIQGIIKKIPSFAEDLRQSRHRQAFQITLEYSHIYF